eukprot:1242933-Prymnesium_polylepis.1
MRGRLWNFSTNRYTLWEHDPAATGAAPGRPGGDRRARCTPPSKTQLVRRSRTPRSVSVSVSCLNAMRERPPVEQRPDHSTPGSPRQCPECKECTATATGRRALASRSWLLLDANVHRVQRTEHENDARRTTGRRGDHAVSRSGGCDILRGRDP